MYGGEKTSVMYNNFDDELIGVRTQQQQQPSTTAPK